MGSPLSISRQLLAQRLRRPTSESGLAEHLQQRSSPARLDRDRFDAELAQFTGPLNRGEQREVAAVRKLLGAASASAALFELPPAPPSRSAIPQQRPLDGTEAQQQYETACGTYPAGGLVPGLDGKTLYKLDLRGGKLFGIDRLTGELKLSAAALPEGTYRQPVLSRDGRTFFVTGTPKQGAEQLFALDAESGELRWSVEPPEAQARSVDGAIISAPALSPDGKRIYAASPDSGELVAFSTQDGAVLARIALPTPMNEGKYGYPSRPLISPDGHDLALEYSNASGQRRVAVADLKTESISWSEERPQGRQFQPVLSPDGKTLYTCTDGLNGMDKSQVHAHDLATGEKRWSRSFYPGHANGGEEELKVSSDGKWLAIRAFQSTAVFDVEDNGRNFATLKQHLGNQTAPEFTGDGSALLVIDTCYGKGRRFDLAERRVTDIQFAEMEDRSYFHSFVPSHDGQWAYTLTGHDGQVKPIKLNPI
jgi:outer membrane protein assembly factor BamB